MPLRIVESFNVSRATLVEVYWTPNMWAQSIFRISLAFPLSNIRKYLVDASITNRTLAYIFPPCPMSELLFYDASVQNIQTKCLK